MLPAPIITPVMHHITGGQLEQLRVETAIHHDAYEVLRVGIRRCIHVHQLVWGGMHNDEYHTAERRRRLRFIPFSLRDNAKKWLYNLIANSISTWAKFVAVFLKKFFSNAQDCGDKERYQSVSPTWQGALLEIFRKVQRSANSMSPPR